MEPSSKAEAPFESRAESRISSFVSLVSSLGASMCNAGGVNNYGFHDDRPTPLSASCLSAV